MNYLVINGYTLPTMSEYIGTTADIVDSGRNTQGVVVAKVIRSDIAKIECKWKYISAESWSDILSLFNPSSGGSFFNECTFFNQTTNSLDTRTFYVGDRTSDGIKLTNSDGSPRGFSGAKLSLVEV